MIQYQTSERIIYVENFSIFFNCYFIFLEWFINVMATIYGAKLQNGIFLVIGKREDINNRTKNNILDMMTKCDIEDVFWLSNEGHVLQVNALFSDKKLFKHLLLCVLLCFDLDWCCTGCSSIKRRYYQM